MAELQFDPNPPAEALRFFRDKDYQIGFNFRDVWREEHSAAFTVAKAMQIDILEDIRAAVDTAIEEGQTFQQFQRQLTPTLQKAGWWGRKALVDPKTGREALVQLGSPRRLKIIYQTNVRTAQAAGQWSRIQAGKEGSPYLLYHLGMAKEHRPEHVTWAGTILPADDPWWHTHFPPNGWNCACGVRQISAREAERLGGVTERPEMRMQRWRNPRTDEWIEVPEGIDPAWAYNPGAHRLQGLPPG